MALRNSNKRLEKRTKPAMILNYQFLIIFLFGSMLIRKPTRRSIDTSAKLSRLFSFNLLPVNYE